MKYIVEYIHPLVDEPQFAICEGVDKTDARDTFYNDNPIVERIVRLTRVSASKA